MAMKKDSLLKAGGFDTNIEFYGEDTDVARRLSKVGHVKFDWHFTMETSGRRLSEEGIITIMMKYIANYVSIMLAKKPVTKEYKDIR